MLYYLLIALTTAAGLAIALILLVGAFRYPSSKPALQLCAYIVGGVVVAWVGYCGWLFSLARDPVYTEADVAGTYRLVMAPRSMAPGTYAGYELNLNADSTFRGQLPGPLASFAKGTFHTESRSASEHVVNFANENSLGLHGSFNPNGGRYQVSFKARQSEADPSSAFVFERVEQVTAP